MIVSTPISAEAVKRRMEFHSFRFINNIMAFTIRLIGEKCLLDISIKRPVPAVCGVAV